MVDFTGSFSIGDHNVNTFLGLANSVSDIKGTRFWRMCGVFDEPGQFSYVLWHAVILNRFTLKSPNVEKVLIYGGFVTMSLAHFVVYAFYIMFVGHINGNHPQFLGVVKALLVLMVAVFVFYLLYVNRELFPIFDRLCFEN